VTLGRLYWPLPLPEIEPSPLAPSSGGRHAGLGPGGGRSFQAITPPYKELYSCPLGLACLLSPLPDGEGGEPKLPPLNPT
jgi:hypothetical protein